MTLVLTSPAFQNGHDIPAKFTAEGRNISPPLKWPGAPAGTKSFALVMEDVDALNSPMTHWMVYQIPADAVVLPENAPQDAHLRTGLLQGRNDFDKLGYSGPQPPRGATHHYVFKLFALNAELKIEAGVKRSDLVKAMSGHILQTAELMGKFQGTGITRTQRTRARATRANSRKAESASATGDIRDPRLDELENDPEYVVQNGALQKRLADAFAADPETVTHFLRRFGFTSALTMSTLREFLKNGANETIGRVLEDYVKFANRFRVYFRLKQKKGTSQVEFKTLPWPRYGEKFHVKYVPAQLIGNDLVTDHLEPAHCTVPPDEPYAEHFRRDDLPVSDAIQKLIEEGKATFVQIDDGPGHSVVKALESVAYKANGVAILQHNAEQPYFICIFGEQTPKELLSRIGVALSEFQRKNFTGRGRGGRPPKMDRLRKAVELEKEPTSLKAKAIDLSGEVDEKTLKKTEVYLSKLRRKSRKD